MRNHLELEVAGYEPEAMMMTSTGIFATICFYTLLVLEGPGCSVREMGWHGLRWLTFASLRLLRLWFRGDALCQFVYRGFGGLLLR